MPVMRGIERPAQQPDASQSPHAALRIFRVRRSRFACFT
jgi:hypothetical protein